MQYFNKKDAEHLINTLQHKYVVTTDFNGKTFCGLDIEWDYVNGWVDISMNNYVKHTLKKLQHASSHRAQHVPHKWTTPTYGQTRQYATPPDTTKQLDKKGQKHVQRVVGSFLYYARSIDNTIITALNKIAAMQAQPTIKTKKSNDYWIIYIHTQMHESDFTLQTW